MARLTSKQQRFVDEYLIDLNATQAAIRAGYSAKTAQEQSSRLLLNVMVQKAIQEAQNKRSERTEITQDAVLNRLWQMATANPNEVVRFRRVNCHYCHGIDHQYQWTVGEFDGQSRKARELELPEPECGGGFGFDRTKEPHPNCPECMGEGFGQIFIYDTSKLTGAAALLYAGAKEGKFGIEIQLHDQFDALIKVGQHLGMFATNNKHEHTGKNGEPIKTENFNANMSEDEVNQRIAELYVKLGLNHV